MSEFPVPPPPWITHIQTQQLEESKARKKGHQNTFLTIFTRFRLFLCVCTRYRLLSIVSEPSHAFSSANTCFRAWSLIFNYFQLFLPFLYIFPSVFTHFNSFSTILDENCFYTLVILSDRVGPGRANSSDFALDPMRAGPGHEKSGPTLALPADSVGGTQLQIHTW